MAYEEENTVPGSLPRFGAIFMSNIATKEECFGRKLLGLPSAQANFVKRIKAGMVLFLFEFERRELYGVFRASSDGAMDIVPHAFSSSGKTFPAQVRFTPIWYCSPLSEREFRHAIKENYFSTKKFNFGLSEDQVYRLLCLFNRRKLEKKLPERQFSRQAGKPIGKDRRVADDGSFFQGNRVEKFVGEYDLGQATGSKCFGNFSSITGKLGDGRFVKTDGIDDELDAEPSFGQAIVMEDPGAALGRRRRRDENGWFLKRDGIEDELDVETYLGHDMDPRSFLVERRDDDGRFLVQDRIEYDHDVDHGFEQTTCVNHPGDLPLCGSGRVARNIRFLPSARAETTHNMNTDIGFIVTTSCPGDSLAEARRAECGRFLLRDIEEDKFTLENGSGLIASSGHLENPVTKARRSTDDHRFFMNSSEVENDCDLDNDPELMSADHYGDSLDKVRRTSDDYKFFTSDRIENEQHVGIRPNILAEHLENHLEKAIDDGKFLKNYRVGIPTKHSANHLDYVKRANDHDRFLVSTGMENENVNKGPLPDISTMQPGYHLNRTRLADEGISLMSNRIENAYNMENCFRPPSLTGYEDFYQSRQSPSLYSSKPMSEPQHEPRRAFPCSMEQNVIEFSYTSSHDATVTSAYPCGSENPDIHSRLSSAVGIGLPVQDFSPRQSPARNFSASTKQSSPYCYQHNAASGCVNEVPLASSLNYYYNCSYGGTSTSLVSAESYREMEARSTGHEVYKGPSLSRSISTSVPFSRSEIYERHNMTPFIDFDKHAVSRGRGEYKIPQHETSQAFSIGDAHLYSGSSQEKSSNHDIKHCHDSTNVFARLSTASEVNVQEEIDRYMGYDEREMDASVDEVKNTEHLYSGSPRENSSNHDIKYYHNSVAMCSDSKGDRTSVFARLTAASEVNVQEENDVNMGYDESGMDASVDEVMSAIHRNLNHGIEKVQNFPLARNHMKGMGKTKRQDMVYSKIEGDKSTVLTTKKQNDVKQPIEENCVQIAEETRVVDFKRRSETKKIQGGMMTKSYVETMEHGNKGSVQKTVDEGLEGKQSKRRKLVRPVFGKKEKQLNEGLSSDASPILQLLSQESASNDNTGCCFDSTGKSLENYDISSSKEKLVQLTCPTGCEDRKNANVEQSSGCKEKIDK